MLKIKLTMVAATVAAMCLATLVGAQECKFTPNAQRTEQNRNKPCADPWINIAYSDNSGGTDGPKGSASVPGTQCDPNMYAGGRWNSYQELCDAVRKSRQALSSNGLKFVKVCKGNGDCAVALVDAAGAVLAGSLIGNDGSTVKTTNPGEMVAAGAGNMVAAGAGNMVAAGGGNIYGLQSGAKKMINLGNGSYLIIK
jgi:hypothetical protein